MQTKSVHHEDIVCSVLRRRDASDKAPVIEDGRVARSWERCLVNHRLAPDAPARHQILESPRLKEIRERNQELIAVANPELENLYRQICGSGFCVLLTNNDGVILEGLFDPGIAQEFMHAGLRMGAEWSEQAEGTNGIGTCISLREPISVHLEEHFFPQNVGLSCSGAPISDPRGDLLGVLDVSSTRCTDSKTSQQHTLALVNMTAKQIANRLFLRAHKDDFLLRFHNRSEFVGILCEGILALDEHGRILAANDNALQILCVDGRDKLMNRALSDFFDTKTSALINHAAKSPYHPMPVNDVRDGRLYYAALQIPKRLLLSPATPRGPVATPRRSPGGSLSGQLTLDQLAGSDPAMQRVAAQARKIIDRDIPILLSGETGTGKEAVARAIHMVSARRSHGFVAINCAAIPENLIESELFGYKSGSFTGARKEGMRGKILQANDGTLFLDEIGDMPLQLQTRLLRVLEEREVLALGAEVPTPVDFNLIVATHRDLLELVERGEFRQDLYFRLNGITLSLPALRERSDLAGLIGQVLELEAGDDGPLHFTSAAMKALLNHDWSGNIRELRNVVRVAVALREGNAIDVDALPETIFRRRTAPHPQFEAPAMPDERGGSSLSLAERDVIAEELNNCRWNVTVAAKNLQMSRATLYRKMRKHGIIAKSASPS